MARFEAFDRDTDGGGGHGIDMAVLDGAGELVGCSLHESSNEAVTLPSPAPGDYRVSTPSKVYAGGAATVGVSWSGLAIGTRYTCAGVVRHSAVRHDGGRRIGRHAPLAVTHGQDMQGRQRGLTVGPSQVKLGAATLLGAERQTLAFSGTGAGCSATNPRICINVPAAAPRCVIDAGLAQATQANNEEREIWRMARRRKEQGLFIIAPVPVQVKRQP